MADFETLVDLMGICIAFMDLGLLNVLLEPHIRRFNLRPIYLGLIFVTQGLAYAIFSPIIGWIVDQGVSLYKLSLIFNILTYSNWNWNFYLNSGSS